MSLEQQNDFIVLRRILKIISPEYVIYTRSDLHANQAVLDAEHKIISISEFTEPKRAIALALFNIGKLRGDVKMPEASDSDAEFDRALAASLARRDKTAAQWAFNAYMAFWPEAGADGNATEVKKMLDECVLTPFRWYRLIAS